MDTETLTITIFRSSGLDQITSEDREQALDGAAGALDAAITSLIGDLADRVLGRPRPGDDGWLEWFRAQEALPARDRDVHLAEWHLVKMQIGRRLGLDHTGEVINARRFGASWSAIGEACGITKQAAYDRWAKYEERQA